MNSQTRTKILNSTWTFIGAALLVGPFALPLLWRNPRVSLATKWTWTVIVIAFTALLFWGSARLTHAILELAQP